MRAEMELGYRARQALRPKDMMNAVFDDETDKQRCLDKSWKFHDALRREVHPTHSSAPQLSDAVLLREQPAMAFHAEFAFELIRCMCGLSVTKRVSGEMLVTAAEPLFLPHRLPWGQQTVPPLSPPQRSCLSPLPQRLQQTSTLENIISRMVGPCY